MKDLFRSPAIMFGLIITADVILYLGMGHLGLFKEITLLVAVHYLHSPQNSHT